jgi:hypothetical protein
MQVGKVCDRGNRCAEGTWTDSLYTRPYWSSEGKPSGQVNSIQATAHTPKENMSSSSAVAEKSNGGWQLHHVPAGHRDQVRPYECMTGMIKDRQWKPTCIYLCAIVQELRGVLLTVVKITSWVLLACPQGSPNLEALLAKGTCLSGKGSLPSTLQNRAAFGQRQSNRRAEGGCSVADFKQEWRSFRLGFSWTAY